MQEPITLVEPSKTNVQLKTKMGEALGDVRFKCWKRAMIFVGETLFFLVRFISYELRLATHGRVKVFFIQRTGSCPPSCWPP